jgi:hypothetical protein
MAFKSPEQVVRNALVADAAVSAVVGSRIYPVLAPSSAALPLITWRRSSVLRTMGLGGPTGVTTVTLSLEIYAETYQAVRELADLCRVALDGYGATVDNVTVSNVSLDNESDGFVQLQGGESAPFLSVSQTYSILWQEI